MTDIQIHYDDGEWAGLYINGCLESVGDASNTEEVALMAAGVKMVHGSAFMRGGNKREHVARCLSDIEFYGRMMQDRERRIQQKISQIAVLQAEIDELRKKTP